MKRRAIACAAALLIMLLSVSARAAGADEAEKDVRGMIESGIDDMMGETDISSLDDIYAKYGGLIGEDTAEDAVKKIAESGLDLSEEETLENCRELLNDVFLAGLPNVVKIVVILLLLGLLANRKQGGITSSAMTVGYIIVAGLAASMVTSSVTAAKGAIDALGSIVDVTTPILVGLLAAMGNFTSQALLSPAMAALTGGIFTVIKTVVFPAILISLVLTVASNVSSVIKLGKMSAFIESAVKWSLGIIMIVFLGTIALKGMSGAAIDGITFKTAKYTIDKMIPVIGGMFSDSLETLLACGLMVKNGVGIVGLLLMATAMAAPLATVVGNVLMFRLAAAVAEPFADDRCTRLLSGLGDSVRLMGVVVLLASAMAFISIAVFIGAANASMMLR